MTDHQNKPAWRSIVGIIICVITFALIFIEFKSRLSLSLIPLIAITLVTGSIAATLLNGVAQIIINAILGPQQEGQPSSEMQHTQQQKNPKKTNQ